MSQREKLLERKRRAMKLMNDGVHWQEATERSGLNYSKSGIQRLYREWCERGDEALIDHRHGHPSKATSEVRNMVHERCEEEPDVRASQLVDEIEAEFGVELNSNYVTALRHLLGLPVPRSGRPGQVGLSQSEREEEPASGEESEQDFPPCGERGLDSALYSWYRTSAV